MVLQELGQKIRDALNKLNKSDDIDKKLLNEMLNAIALALIKSDVNLRMVKSLQEKIPERPRHSDGCRPRSTGSRYYHR